jgi:V/A-type H+-transporting ATPase subunit K
MYVFLFPLLVVILLSLPLVNIARKRSGKKARMAILANLASFFGVLIFCAIFPVGEQLYVYAEEAAEGNPAAVSLLENTVAMGYLSAALAVGLGSIGCGIAVGGAAPAAIGAVSEDPKSFSRALIFVALGEGVAIYGLLIAFMIIGRL